MAAFFDKRKRANPLKPGGRTFGLLTRTSVAAVLALLLLISSVLLNLFLLKRVDLQKKEIVVQKKVLVEVREPDNAASEIKGRWYGLVPKNSIQSIDGFRRMVAEDPLLALHFADFDWANARMEKLPDATWTHVAYRKDGKIRMTRKVIRLPKGDCYITDGKRCVRTYCGNDYVLAGSEERLTPTAYELVGSGEDDVVPEPSTYLLFAIGLAGLALSGYRRKRPA